MIQPDKLESVAIIGNGLMGQGISQVFATAGKTVRLIGRNPDSLSKAMTTIAGNINAFVDRGLISSEDAVSTLARITTSTDYNDAASANHVIEAVPAVRELQIEVFQRMDEICEPEIVIGSTSGQPISLMVGNMKHPHRAVAIHFVYPAQLIPVVEVCGGESTSPEVVAWACDMLKAMGRTPALMNKEVDGFIINRLQFALLREAWSMSRQKHPPFGRFRPGTSKPDRAAQETWKAWRHFLLSQLTHRPAFEWQIEQRSLLLCSKAFFIPCATPRSTRISGSHNAHRS